MSKRVKLTLFIYTTFINTCVTPDQIIGKKKKVDILLLLALKKEVWMYYEVQVKSLREQGVMKICVKI